MYTLEAMEIEILTRLYELGILNLSSCNNIK